MSAELQQALDVAQRLLDDGDETAALAVIARVLDVAEAVARERWPNLPRPAPAPEPWPAG